ncbi:MAG: hypothetical protein KGO47_07315 [Cyanobacteria bacterium REEB417]|nr:hypothetical protein [Cyanobacteria bacterium REEB417]
MKANPDSLPAEQARELGLAVGDTIQGRGYVGDYWHEARITLLWIGTVPTVWIVSGRSSRPRESAWSAPHEGTDWDLSCRDWQRIETPPEHAALLPAPAITTSRPATVAEVRAADAAISDEAVAAEYRAWWGASYGVPPNNQAVAVAVAWGRHLLTRGQA